MPRTPANSRGGSASSGWKKQTSHGSHGATTDTARGSRDSHSSAKAGTSRSTGGNHTVTESTSKNTGESVKYKKGSTDSSYVRIADSSSGINVSGTAGSKVSKNDSSQSNKDSGKGSHSKTHSPTDGRHSVSVGKQYGSREISKSDTSQSKRESVSGTAGFKVSKSDSSQSNKDSGKGSHSKAHSLTDGRSSLPVGQLYDRKSYNRDSGKGSLSRAHSPTGGRNSAPKSTVNKNVHEDSGAPPNNSILPRSGMSRTKDDQTADSISSSNATAKQTFNGDGSRVYKDNQLNRKLGRVDKLLGTMVYSGKKKLSVNRSLGRVDILRGSLPVPRKSKHAQQKQEFLQQIQNDEYIVEKTIKISQAPNNSQGFGLFIKGVSEKQEPVIIHKVSLGSSADISGVLANDEVLSVNNLDISNMTLKQVQAIIDDSVKRGQVELTVRRQPDEGISVLKSIDPFTLRHVLCQNKRSRKVVDAYLHLLCAAAEEYFHDALCVWIGYKAEDCHLEPKIVTLYKDINVIKDLKFQTFQVIQRNITTFSTEAEYVAALERKTNSCLSMTEQRNFEQWVDKNAYDLMTNHSNLLIISVSKYRSRKFGKDIEPQTCVVLYVHVKGIIPYGEKAFPKELDGFPIDVRESVFEFYMMSNKKFEKVRIGCTIATDYETSGTLGGFLKSVGTETIYGLTCCHIFKTKKNQHLFKKEKKTGKNHTKSISRKVFQPNDVNSNLIGEVVKFIDYEELEDITVDAAVIYIRKRHPENWCISNAEEYEYEYEYCKDSENKAFEELEQVHEKLQKLREEDRKLQKLREEDRKLQKLREEAGEQTPKVEEAQEELQQRLTREQESTLSELKGLVAKNPVLFNSGEVINSFAEIPENCIVIKCGARTGLTAGFVYLKKAPVKNEDRADLHEGHSVYGQIEVRPFIDDQFSASGDSGSLVFAVCKKEKGSGCALKGLGLLIGGVGKMATYITPIWAVLSRLQIQEPFQLYTFDSTERDARPAEERLKAVEDNIVSITSELDTKASSAELTAFKMEVNVNLEKTAKSSELTAFKMEVNVNLEKISSEIQEIKSFLVDNQGTT